MGSIYEQDMLHAIGHYGNIATEYEWRYGHDTQMQERFISPLRPELTSSSLVLDLCCGSGSFSRGLTAAGIERYIGVDASDRMIARARHVFPGRDFRVGRAESLQSVVPEVCDAFTIVHGFSHIPPSAAVACMRGLRTVLRAGAVGVAIIGATVPQPHSKVMRPARSRVDIQKRTGGWPNLIAVAWSVREFCACFEKAGFTHLDRAPEHYDPDNLAFYFEAV